MNTLSKFKESIGIANTALDFRKSSSSERYWAKAITPDNKVISFVTTIDFDHSKECFVVPTEVKVIDEETGEETGEVNIVNVLTNKVPAEVSFTM